MAKRGGRGKGKPRYSVVGEGLALAAHSGDAILDFWGVVAQSLLPGLRL
jgi:hypothetical protein